MKTEDETVHEVSIQTVVPFANKNKLSYFPIKKSTVNYVTLVSKALEIFPSNTGLDPNKPDKNFTLFTLHP